MTDPEAVTCEQVVRAPPGEVFRWFVDPDLLAGWIGIRAALEPRPGGSFRFEIVPGEWCSGRYLEIVLDRRVVFTWGWDSGAIPVPPGSSTVEVDLEPHPTAPWSAWSTATWPPRSAPSTPRAGPGSSPASPRPSPAATRPPTPHHCPRRSRGHRHQGRDRRRPPPRSGRRLPPRPRQRPPLDRRPPLRPAGHPTPVTVGSQVEGVASFFGRRIEYVNEITEPTDTRLAMRSICSPFPLRVTYTFIDAGKKATEVSVRVEGDARRLYRLADPFLALLVRRSVQRDLRSLKRNLENGTGSR